MSPLSSWLTKSTDGRGQRTGAWRSACGRSTDWGRLHAGIGVEQRELTRRCDVPNDEGSLADAPEALAPLEVWQLGSLSH
jgi:hypothetical protein